MTFGPAAGLEAIPEADPQLVGYHRWHAARADLLRRLGDHARAAEEFALAADLASNAAERRWLSDRSRQLGDAASR